MRLTACPRLSSGAAERTEARPAPVQRAASTAVKSSHRAAIHTSLGHKRRSHRITKPNRSDEGPWLGCNTSSVRLHKQAHKEDALGASQRPHGFNISHREEKNGPTGCVCACVRVDVCACVCVFSLKFPPKCAWSCGAAVKTSPLCLCFFFFFFLNGAQRFPGPSGGEAVAAETKPSDGCLTKAAARCSHGEHRPSLIFRYF